MNDVTLIFAEKIPDQITKERPKESNKVVLPQEISLDQ
jgi:hypothetical protein